MTSEKIKIQHKRKICLYLNHSRWCWRKKTFWLLGWGGGGEEGEQKIAGIFFTCANITDLIPKFHNFT